ncbi:PREDICTED: protein furry homolog-like [Priapulus caudatus]|uniref:Protein furry homolog-like n=1 Tax=Priapulus caudatus TaxID=37621 RepID=A0ABM1F5X2_PRICU|nr:PREDICTED: protein furry homolog-like [Priapulus caudatus]
MVGSEGLQWVQKGQDEVRRGMVGSEGLQWVQKGQDEVRRGMVGSEGLQWVQKGQMMLCSVLEQHKFCVLEIQEHFETYSERREHAVECLDGIKSSLKLQSLGETMHNFSGEEQRVEMCRSLYKLHFQLLLLFQSFAKLISLLQTGCKLAQISDFSRDVSCLQQDLRKAIHDLEHGHIEHTSPLPPLDLMTFDQSLAECNLAEQLCKGKLIGAVKLLHTYSK